eukprot:Protomagalhaensia_sp_Gyna_25__4956@NODE_537_length_3183_cov_33_048982_g421_i0_p2_GENE_NODE_537_length_3183_cov_33_048982_g421_i0NODE_537_length_3183_cov_33_048982_g421_i0_p2_ORF_typecomplete_len134_score17_83Glyco_hydro_1/PF00232_18/0_17_NODE_537_length_3183_cov_33_048982_g421_i0380781
MMVQTSLILLAFSLSWARILPFHKGPILPPSAPPLFHTEKNIDQARRLLMSEVVLLKTCRGASNRLRSVGRLLRLPGWEGVARAQSHISKARVDLEKHILSIENPTSREAKCLEILRDSDAMHLEINQILQRQ